MTGTDDPSAPIWASQRGVAACIVGYCLLFAFLNGPLASGIGVDDAVEMYVTQVVLLNYSARNPPLFDWLLMALQEITGANRFSLITLRYVLLAVTALLIYVIARRIIRDARLQAIAVYSMSLSWLIGYHSHRIITHSNVMIAAIAGFMLVLMALRTRRDVCLYSALGVTIVAGTLGKYGFVAFAAAALLAAAALPDYRRVVISSATLATLLAASVPLLAFFAVVHLQEAGVGDAIARVVLANRAAEPAAAAGALAAGIAGYLLPFALVVAPLLVPAVRRPERPCLDPSTTRLILWVTCLGTGLSLAAAFGGNPNMRDRYLHVWYLLLPVATFSIIDRTHVSQATYRRLNAVLIATVVVVATLVAAQRLAPSRALCGACEQSAPYPQLGRQIVARFGPAPTLLADSVLSAGQMRAGLPDARLIAADDRYGRRAPRPPGPCLAVWDRGKPGAEAAIDARLRHEGLSISLADAASVRVIWWAPLLPGGRITDWAVLSIPADASLCR